eukprot:TRINITY_DN4711_c0_g1_i3.p1 TRINITY_DN4711_c0_g1~~TRINITY_DN4711_c0_g1_i3.p1  ORF type:complete len:288 (-),score=68.02 TRINITY_DN4711_c0_g1_i3:50-913(-)
MDDGSFQLTPEDDGFLEGVLAEMADELMAEESAWPSDNQFPDSLCVPQLNPAGSIPGDEQCNSVALPVAVANLNHSSSNNNSNSNKHNNHNHSNSDTTQSTKNGGNNNSDDDNNKNGPCRPDDAFLKLSFDAMAMVDPAGELLWENPAFHNLSLFAGAGEKVEGLRRLKACFLSGIPPERHITRKVLQAEGAAEVVLCSATQVLNQSVLWVVNQPFLPLLKQQQLAYPKASVPVPWSRQPVSASGMVRSASGMARPASGMRKSASAMRKSASVMIRVQCRDRSQPAS